MDILQEMQAQAAVNAAFANALRSALGVQPLDAADSALPPDMGLCNLPWELRPLDPGGADTETWPHVRFQGEWYPVPSMGELEEFVYDSDCFTPVDDEVEPDHPHSWLSILGLI